MFFVLFFPPPFFPTPPPLPPPPSRDYGTKKKKIPQRAELVKKFCHFKLITVIVMGVSFGSDPITTRSRTSHGA